MSNSPLRNPHLAGSAFTFEGGQDGVLLVHGLTATTAEVRPLAHHLHGLGYTISGPLLPGHNAQPLDINRYRWQDWMSTVRGAYTELKARCQRVIAGGESTGALLTLLLAAEQPEIAGVLSFAPALRLNLGPADLAKLRILAPFVGAVPKRLGQSSEADELWQGYTVNPLKGARELVRLQQIVRGRLSHIRQPILVAQGRLDGTVHPTAPQEVYDKVGSSVKELHWFDHSTHCVALDCERQQLFELTSRFIERVLNAHSEV